MPQNARAMAMVPEGAEVLPNVRGAAPGMVLDGEEGSCVFLPGVPREMRQIFRDGVAPLIGRRFSGALRPATHRVIHTAGIFESVLSESIAREIPDGIGPVSLAFLPDMRGVRLRLSARDEPGGETAQRLLDHAESALEAVVAPYRYRSPEGELVQAVGEALLTAGKSLATAESCTGGLIAKRLTDRPGSSRYFVGGVVAYADEVKAGILGVDEALLAREGAVSPAVAEAMASGVARALGVAAGIGVTGIAGPEGDTPEKPVGTVCYAVALDGRVVSRRERFTGDREMVRERSAQAALFLLLGLLDGREG
jgi:nicotinamide-nucleotide amidase